MKILAQSKSKKKLNWPTLSGLKNTLKEFINAFANHDLMTLAAALAFYTALALAPLLMITLSVVGILGETSKNNLINEINTLMGSNASIAINAIIESANQNPRSGGVAGLIGILVILFSASGVFAQLQSSLNVIWQSESEPTAGVWSWIRKRLLSMGIVLSLGFISLVSLIVSTVLSSIFNQQQWIWKAVNFSVSALIFTSVFSLIFKYLPDAKISWKNSWIGGMITSVLFLIGKSVISLYLGKSAVGSAYGAAGSIVVLLAWVYYSSIIVFSGAELTRIICAEDGNVEAIEAGKTTKITAHLKTATQT